MERVICGSIKVVDLNYFKNYNNMQHDSSGNIKDFDKLMGFSYMFKLTFSLFIKKYLDSFNT